MSCRAIRNTLALSLLALGLAAVPALASNHEVCDGFNRKQRISRLGGRASFTKTPVTSAANLKEQLDTHRAEVEALMAEKGVGHLTDALYAAAAAGKVTERDLERGEVFEWMVYRKRSGATAFGPMCVDAKKTYDAYIIEVTEEEPHPAKAECSLKVTGGDCVGDRFVIDTAGSSAGVKVDIAGPGGSKNPPEVPGTYKITASAQARGTKTVTTHTFVIPKICLNLAYSGKTSGEEEGETDTCQQTASATVKDCTPEPEPKPESEPEPEPEPEMSRWTARFFGLRLYPDEGPLNESTIRPNGVSERSHLHLEGGPGAGVDLEYHFNDRIGLAASALYATLEGEMFFDLDNDWESGEDDISFLSFLIGPNFHLTPDKKVDVYIGPFIGLVDLGSVSYRLLGETQSRSLDSDMVFGAQLGVDIPFKGNWAVHLGTRYLDMNVETGEDGPEIAADPLVVEAGFAYKF